MLHQNSDIILPQSIAVMRGMTMVARVMRPVLLGGVLMGEIHAVTSVKKAEEITAVVDYDNESRVMRIVALKCV